ncbi:MAG TPA: hypothetical protein VIV55_01135 [Flavobacterium sp.]
MKKLLFALTLIPFVFLTGFMVKNNNPLENNTKKLTNLQTKLRLQELKNPLQYLTTDVMVKANLILIKKETLFNDAQYKDDGYLIEGTIKNNADFANFKNLVFRVNFYSISQTKIGSKDYVLNESYKPHSNKSILLKMYPPEGYVEFGFEIVDASGI